MDDKRCSECARWRYNRWTEEKYGMGVGVCAGDNTPVFCDRKACFAYAEPENEGDDNG